jgi:glutathione-regulated potassium-efflux system protein KefB
MDLGIEHIFRETLLSSLAMSEQVLNSLGQTNEDARHIVDSFRELDERLLLEQQAIHDSEELLIQSSKDTATELESLLRQDNPDD